MRRFSIGMDEEQARTPNNNSKSMGGDSDSNKLSKYDNNNAPRKNFFSVIYRLCTLRTLLVTLFILCVVEIAVIVVYSNPYSGKTAIIVLGGGLTEKGECPPHTQLRLEKAMEIYNKSKSQNGAVIIPLSGGTPYKPNPVDEKGFPIWEATAAAKQLIKMGVPYSDILEEAFSLDTVGNAYYLRTTHTDPAKLRKLVIVTNSWHMPRARAIFEYVFQLPLTSSSSASSAIHSIASLPMLVASKLLWLVGCEDRYHLDFEAAAAGIEDADILAARVKKEADAADAFKAKTTQQFDSMDTFHRWLFSQHNAYSTARHVKKAGLAASLTKEEALLMKTY